MSDYENAYQEAIDLVKEKFEKTYELVETEHNYLDLLLSNLLNAAGQLELNKITVSIDEDVAIDDPAPIDPHPVVPDITVTMPTAPTAVYPVIDVSDHVAPDVRDLLLPAVSIDPGQNTYVSNLLNSLKTKILHDVDEGGTGLDPLVETDIWNRNYERDLQANHDAMDRISSEWAKRGNPLPDGFFANQITEQEINFTNKRLDTSRDISIKQAELAQTNTHFAIEKGISIETQMMTIENTFMERIYQASKAVTEANISLYNSQLQSYKIWSDIYQVLVNTDIETAKAVIDVYRTQVEAYKAGVQGEAERIKAILTKPQIETEIWKAQVSVYDSMANIDIKMLDARLKKSMANAEIALKNAEIDIKEYEVISGLQLDSMKTSALIQSHLVSGLLSAVSAGASISGSGATQTQTSYKGAALGGAGSPTDVTHQHVYQET